MRLVVVFENIATSPDVKLMFVLRNDSLGEVEDSLLTIRVTLDKEDFLLATEQRVLCHVAVRVDNDKLVVSCGDKGVDGIVFWVLDQGHVNHLLFNSYLTHTEIKWLVGEVKQNQAVSVRNYE